MSDEQRHLRALLADLRREVWAAEEEAHTYTFKTRGEGHTILKRLLLMMEYLGQVGSSRTIEFGFDGDGPDRIEVEDLDGELGPIEDNGAGTVPLPGLKKADIGFPGGPCHVIRDIEEESLPDRLKSELIEDIEKGKDLSNQKADLVYDRTKVPTKVPEFPYILLTAHAVYRMNQRGVTVYELQKALDEFSRWYKAKKTQDKRLRPEEMDIFQNLAKGEPLKFQASKIGLTVVFVLDQKRSEARLISTWWTNTPNPKKPRPGECEYIDYLDRERLEIPKILGASYEPPTNFDAWEDSYEQERLDYFDIEAGRPEGETQWGGKPNPDYDDRPVPQENRRENKEYRLKYHTDSRFREKKKREEKLRYRYIDVQHKKRRERNDNRAGAMDELNEMARELRDRVTRIACGGDCGCGGDCKCGGNCGCETKDSGAGWEDFPEGPDAWDTDTFVPDVSPDRSDYYI